MTMFDRHSTSSLCIIYTFVQSYEYLFGQFWRKLTVRKGSQAVPCTSLLTILEKIDHGKKGASCTMNKYYSHLTHFWHSDTIWRHGFSVNIGSGNGLLSYGTKSLPERISIYHLGVFVHSPEGKFITTLLFCTCTISLNITLLKLQPLFPQASELTHRKLLVS